MIQFNSNISFESDFIKNNQVKAVSVTEFDIKSKNEFVKDCDKVINSRQEFLPIIIDSYGGYVYPVLGMVDYLKGVKIPIITICETIAMSCGSVLFTCGERRIMTENSTVLFHDMTDCLIGKDIDLQADAKHSTKLKNILFETISKNLGYEKKWLHKELLSRGNSDWSIMAKEAKRLNIATEIGTPKLITTITKKQEIKI